MKNTAIITILLLAVIGGGAFFGGMKFQQTRQPAFLRQSGGLPGQRAGGIRTGLRPVAGDIISTDDKSITVKQPDGTSRIVIISDKTTINKASQGTRNDLKMGERVAVFGQDNPDGSVTAQNIQLNPATRAGQSQNPGQ